MLAVILAYKEAFAKYGRDKLDSRGEPYDYGSIMHYPWNAFSTNGRNTVKPKRRVVNPPYRVLSKSDAIQANRMYNCDSEFYISISILLNTLCIDSSYNSNVI